ncbi:hypothetical protein BYT27DRAFT_7250611 [Phlegmacium glaucopus]|nr:hypothetical protein BYT27DRAFT_7250611 [Phlegmacium glaucopus]
MYRSQLIRISQASLRPVVFNPVSSRAYTVTPPPPTGQAAPNPKAKQADNTLLYTTLGLVAAAGAYYYFRNTDEAQELKDKAKADQDQLKRRSAELADAVKARADDVKQQGKAKLDQVKTDSKDFVRSTEREAETRGRGIAGDLEAKYDSVKSSAKENLTRARESSENLYNEARTATEQKTANAQKKIENGWFSWFNWGKSKSDDIESEAERLKGKGERNT